MNRTVELLRLLSVCEQVDGRKKLQKLVHILKESGFAFDYRFVFHFHGPFSVEVKADVDALVREGLVEEQSGNTPGGEYQQYTYRIRTAATELLGRLTAPEEPAWEALARTLASKGAQELEAISTLLYLQRRGLQDERLHDRFAELKPHLSPLHGPAMTFISSHLPKRCPS